MEAIDLSTVDWKTAFDGVPVDSNGTPALVVRPQQRYTQCSRCGAIIDQTGGPRPDLCDACFDEYVALACRVTPAQLLAERLEGEW